MVDVLGTWLWLLAQASMGQVALSPTERIQAWLTENPIASWSIAIFIVLAAAVAALANLIGNLDNIIGFFAKYRPTTEAQRQKLIKDELEQVLKRLQDSLDLEREEEPQRIGQRDLPTSQSIASSDQLINREFNPFDTPAPPNPMKSTVTLLKGDDIKGRLLILGEPGVGKTNELLTVAKALLQQAKESDNKSIPVIFELSEWSSEPGETFANWLSKKLREKYKVPPALSQHWIEQNQLFPLLDGLDELRRIGDRNNATPEEADRKRQAKQIACIRAINEFLDMHPSASMVVCCRHQEYQALKQQGEYLKRLNGAIYLKVLDDDQIRDYLMTHARGTLWNALKKQPDLLELARSPLFLLMLAVVPYQGQPIQSSNELLDLYIESRLADLNNKGAYASDKAPSDERTRHYLCWLATKLEEQEVTEFLIERLQPSWLDQERDKKLYRLSIETVFGLLFGLSGGLHFGLIGWLKSGLLGGLLGLFGGLLFGWWLGMIAELLFGSGDIDLSDNFQFSWQRGLKVGFFSSLFAVLANGLSFGLFALLFFGVLAGPKFSESDLHDKRDPNQAIKRRGKTSLLFALVFGLLFGPFFGLIVGLFVGLLVGRGVVIRHSALRFVLYQTGVAPWNYAKFLEHAENHRFIQRVGGRYRFAHDLLRKRFAERYNPRAPRKIRILLRMATRLPWF